MNHPAQHQARPLTDVCQNALIDLARSLEAADGTEAALEASALCLSEYWAAAWSRTGAEPASTEIEGRLAIDRARRTGQVATQAARGTGRATLALPVRTANAPFAFP